MPARRPKAAYDAAYWASEAASGSGSPPDFRGGGIVSPVGTPPMRIGPWQVGCSVAGDNMFWLTAPDTTYSVKAYEPDKLPAEVQQLAEHLSSAETRTAD